MPGQGDAYSLEATFFIDRITVNLDRYVPLSFTAPLASSILGWNPVKSL